MNSTERILHYTNNIPQETKMGDDRNGEDNKSEWPTNGHLIVQNLKMRYRKTTELVLKGCNFEIQSGQRVGVVGRTGT